MAAWYPVFCNLSILPAQLTEEMVSLLRLQATEDMIRKQSTSAAPRSLWPSSDGESDFCSSCLSSITATPNPLSIFTPFWVRPFIPENLPAPVTISYVEYFPAPSEEDDSIYFGYEDEDDHSFAEDEEAHPVKEALTKVASFWRKIFS